jgi:hypothetical protein
MAKFNDLGVFEADLRTALKSTGHLFPTTDTEIDYFLAHSEEVSMPEKYEDPGFILRKEFTPVEKENRATTVDITRTEQGWAMAARNGKELPQYILNRMHDDKENSKKK